MSSTDFVSQVKEAKAYVHSFYLWPEAWKDYVEQGKYAANWNVYKFVEGQANKVPKQPGLYTFLIQPRVAGHPACSYLMYVGITERSLRDRFKEYLREKESDKGRPKIVMLLNQYPDHVYFCCSVAPPGSNLEEIERALQCALAPPCNDQLPSEVARIMGALR